MAKKKKRNVHRKSSKKIRVKSRPVRRLRKVSYKKRPARRVAKKRKSGPKKRKHTLKRLKKVQRSRVRRAKARRTVAIRTPQNDEPLLELLTGSAIRARTLRLILREPQLLFTLHDVAERLHVPLFAVRQEARRLEALGLVTLRGSKRLAVNPTFPFLSELRTLSVRPFPVSRQWLLRTLSSAGKLQLVIVSGVFLQAPQARVDIFVVASRYSERRLENAAKKLEAAVGAELRWAGMETKEFNYRWRMFDRFLRDVFTQPHERVLERIKITT